jgi:hypothetical protein
MEAGASPAAVEKDCDDWVGVPGKLAVKPAPAGDMAVQSEPAACVGVALGTAVALTVAVGARVGVTATVAATEAAAEAAVVGASLAPLLGCGNPLDEQAERRIALLSTTRTNRRTKVLAFL